MLIGDKFPLNPTKLAQEDQALILSGMIWSDFEQLINEEYLGYRVSYKHGEITIVSPGRNHERIGKTIKLVLINYLIIIIKKLLKAIV